MYLFNRAENVNGTILLPPRPFVVSSTGTFDGNDGKWSTFFINVGGSDKVHGQNFKVLPSTSSPITIIPREVSWCNDDECATRRGVEQFNGKQPLGFETANSQSWNQAGTYDFPLPRWWNGSVSGIWGKDTVGLGQANADSEMLGEQYVGLSQDEDLFMGSFGLAAGAIAPAGAAKPTFLVNFDDFNRIASTSYGYTAGASYRNDNKGVIGSLVLGGYDKSRMKDQGISIPFPNDKNTTLAVGIQSITYTPAPNVDDSVTSFTESGFEAGIDSTLPYLELPDAIVDKFAEKFRLTFDEGRNMYTVNQSSHNFNTRQDATVSFKIGASARNSAEFTTIDLPYSAFDLEASTPIFDNATRYFPIRKSPKNIMVLGRAFLQEAYIIVDYERANFTVAPLRADPLPDSELITIFNKTYVMPAATDPPPAPAGKDGIAPGAIAGIVVGVVLVAVLGAVGVFFWYRRRRQHTQPPVKEIHEDKTSDIDTMVAGNEVKHRRVSELSGSQPAGSPKPPMAGGYYGGGDVKEFPPISEMSPESPPAELYSPPQGSLTPYSEGQSDYFIAGNKVRGRGRGSSSGNSPGTPAYLAELPGDDGGFQVGGQHFVPMAGKGNIDEVMTRPEKAPLEKPQSESAALATVSADKEEEKEEEKTTQAKEEETVTPAKEGDKPAAPAAPAAAAAEKVEENVATEQSSSKEEEKPTEKTEASDQKPTDKPASDEPETGATPRRPSHTRGLSDITVQSESTAVSQPTPEEMQQWAASGNEPRRPLSQ